jgi:hypothetical protein
VVRNQLSTLRTQLTDDLRSRLPPGAERKQETDTTDHSPSRPKQARGEALALLLKKRAEQRAAAPANATESQHPARA